MYISFCVPKKYRPQKNRRRLADIILRQTSSRLFGSGVFFIYIFFFVLFLCFSTDPRDFTMWSPVLAIVTHGQHVTTFSAPDSLNSRPVHKSHYDTIRSILTSLKYIISNTILTRQSVCFWGPDDPRT